MKNYSKYKKRLYDIDYSKMNIRFANFEIEELNNFVIYFREEKKMIFLITQPSSPKFDTELIKNGKSTNKTIIYLEKINELDYLIDLYNKRIENLSKYVELELKRLEKYEPLQKAIIEKREIEKKQWKDIANEVNYSVRQCLRIYSKYKKCR